MKDVQMHCAIMICATLGAIFAMAGAAASMYGMEGVFVLSWVVAANMILLAVILYIIK